MKVSYLAILKPQQHEGKSITNLKPRQRHFEISNRKHRVERSETKHVVATNTRIFQPKMLRGK